MRKINKYKLQNRRGLDIKENYEDNTLNLTYHIT